MLHRKKPIGVLLPQQNAYWIIYGIKDKNGKPISQCAIMEYVRTNSSGYGTWGCCTPDPPTPGWEHPCNKGVPFGVFDERGSVKSILWNFGNFPCIGFNTAQNTYNIEQNLTKNLLMFAQWNYYNPPFGASEAHAVVIRGVNVMTSTVYYMDPAPQSFWAGGGGLDSLSWNDFYDNSNNNNNDAKRWWGTTLSLTDCSSGRGGDYPCHCYNGYNDEDETGIDCGGSCPKCTTTNPWLCMNRKHDADTGEEGVDCGGPCPQRCEDLPPCANCKKDPDELMMDCGGSCGSCYDVLDEIILTSTAQLYTNNNTYSPGPMRPNIMAFNKITAKDATSVKSGQTIIFITEEEGKIVLLPGFHAERGSSFTTQRKDLSGSSRICGAICRIEHLSHHHSVTMGSDFLRIYNLFNAVEIEYEIMDFESGGVKIYENSLDITRNGKFYLWNCLSGTTNPTGRVWYYVWYNIFYCNNSSYSGTHHFYVNYPSNKSSTEEPDEPENLAPSHFPSSGNLQIQDGVGYPVLSVIPNPNTGAFQVETNFSLSEIAHFKIINSLGATVYETQNLFSNTIQLQNSTSGLHFVVAMLKDGTMLSQKMVIQR